MSWRYLLVSLVVAMGCEGSDPVESCRALHPDCQTLCNDLCARLAECTTPGATTCAEECERDYLCAGESPDQDGTICRNRSSMSSTLTCAELCAESSFGQECPP
jgi:hypothetical protein